ncbi:MAG: hypothetical protein Q9201_002878 [Fulgogasparrea decipioides]
MPSVEGKDIKATAAAWVAGLQAVPGIAGVLWPQNNDNAQEPPQDGSSNSASSNETDVYYKRISNAYDYVMSDVNTFLAFVSSSIISFAGSRPHWFQQGDYEVTVGAKTFVTSRLMQEYGFFATPGDISDHSFSERQSSDSCPSVKANGSVCEYPDGGVVYWSPTTHRQYELRIKAHKPVISKSALMDNITTQGWADAQLLFDGNYNCTAEGRAGGAMVAASDPMDVSCISQLPMYRDCDMDCPTTLLVDSECPFGFSKVCCRGLLCV